MEFRSVRSVDLDEVLRLEQESYPSDEAATKDMMAHRIRVAADCFRVVRQNDSLSGFVCGTRFSGQTLTHASMHEHDPEGASLCIHSVVVRVDLRRSGIGSELLADYIEHAREELKALDRVLLIAKAHLLDFYGAAGFALVGPSRVVHGRDPWFEMALDI